MNEFRQDPLTGDWILIAPGRGKRPNSREKISFPAHECPFDGLTSFVEVQPNKFPAVQMGQCGPILAQGIYSVAAGIGSHELVLTKDHDRFYPNFTDQEMKQVVDTYLQRYKILSADQCNKYVLIFHNHGVLAGASIKHNHSQILTTPIMPPHVENMFNRCKDYLKNKSSNLFTELLESEKGRIVSENENFVAFCPFASRSPYEVNIFPKKLEPNFANLSDDESLSLAKLMREVFVRYDKALSDPDYTYLIHSGTDLSFVWHIEILPRFSPAAGFEFGTNIFINTVDPDEAATELRTVAL